MADDRKDVRVDLLPKLDERAQLAVKAFLRKRADAVQQGIVVNLILGHLSGISSSQKANLTEREAGFLSGRQWVGITLADIGKLSLYQVEIDDD